MAKNQEVVEAGPVAGPVKPKRPQAPKRPNSRYVEVQPATSSRGIRYQIKAAGYALVAEMAHGGCSQASIAAALGFHSSTLTDMKRNDPLLVEALTRGHGILEDEVVSTLVRHMREGSTTAAIFLAKGKLNFRDVGPADPHAQSGPVVNIVVPPALSIEDARALLQGATAKVIDHE